METEKNAKKKLAEEDYRGVVSIPYVRRVSEQSRRMAMKRGF